MAKKATTQKKKAAKPVKTMTGFANDIYTPGAMPYVNNIRRPALVDCTTGTICVKGKAFLDGNSPDEAWAKIFRSQQSSPPATPPTGATQGVTGNFNEFGIVYNYRFIRGDGGTDHDVENAKGGTQNWLVLWLLFDETWEISQMQFKGQLADTTECESTASSFK